MRQKRHTRPSSGILTRCPSTSPFGYALGPTNPGTIIVALETLGMRWAGFSPAKFVTHANILTSYRSTSVYTFASLLYERSSTACNKLHARVFGTMLSPVIFSAQDFLTRSVSCYALFNRWLLLSQLPDCLGNLTSFPT
jgi:hypothetical protein